MNYPFPPFYCTHTLVQSRTRVVTKVQIHLDRLTICTHSFNFVVAVVVENFCHEFLAWDNG